MNGRATRWIRTALASGLLVGLAGLLSGATAAAAGPLADYDVAVEIENATPEAKADWPVILTVYKVLGRNLPAGTVNPAGFHVYDEKGKEIPHAIEAIPPLDQPGNDEIVFVIPKIGKGRTLRYRITNTAKASSKRTKLDVVASRHNLIRNGGFEEAGTKTLPAGWQYDGRRDAEVRRSGSASLRLRGTSRRSAGHAAKMPLHPASRYYFGIWGKTHEVSRHGIHTSRGGYFTLKGLDSGWSGILRDWRGKALTDRDGNIVAKDLDTRQQRSLKQSLVGMKAAWIFPQCYTRDWFKSLPLVRSFTGWGLPEMCMTAAAESAELTITLDQRRQFVRPADQAGTWWLDDAVLIEQPKVTVRFDELLRHFDEQNRFRRVVVNTVLTGSDGADATFMHNLAILTGGMFKMVDVD